MSNNKIEIKAIGELLGLKFFIPSYQRGYRWTEQQVTDLLNDINKFSPEKIPNSDEKTWYCLQPVVVKKKNDEGYEVIDGQQRLTTIFLIIHYVNEKWVKDQKVPELDLTYETRQKSSEFLKKQKIKESEDEANKENIDFYHISKAYNKIHKWVKDQKDFDNDDFQLKLKLHSKVIWYEISDDEDPIDIFTRINSGKIPLTNAELIKALFLNISNFKGADTEKLRLKQLEIACEWDRIEYALQDDAFWYFINKQENNLPTRIEFIFKLMADNTEDKDDYATFRFFYEKFKNDSEEEVNGNWQEIKKYFQTLEEWFNDRVLYHKIGFLIAAGTDVKRILEGKNKQTKTDFQNWLNEKIKEKVNVDISKLEYGDKNIRNVLLLHNIQTMLNNSNETNRFPFNRYKKESWDVEHIHAIATKVKVNKKDQIKWLENNVKEKTIEDEKLNDKIKKIKEGETIEDEEFYPIIEYVLGEEDNTLQNLCLLDSTTNRSYKNDSFKVKRQKIIEREKEGTFIPICTKNVFLKYYTKNVTDLEVWNKEEDRGDYISDIEEVLISYLPQKTSAENEQ